MTTDVPVMVSEGGPFTPRTVTVCREIVVRLVVNGHAVMAQRMSPDHLPEFACGYLVSEGIISRPDQIQSIRVSPAGIEVIAGGVAEAGPGISQTSGGVDLGRRPGEPVRSDLCIDRDTIYAAVDCLNDFAVLWKETGGTHCTVLFDAGGTAVAHAEDIGRHNSVDKVIGMALLAGIDPGRTFIACSGRMPVDMVNKAWHAGIPVMVSNNAPSASGIERAREGDITLVGFVRPPRMTVYTGIERIRL